MNARRHGSVMVASALIATLMLSSPALTVGPGPGGGGGGGGGQPGDTTGSIYADLVIALRAENGTPILQKYTIDDAETGEETTEYCVQPVSYEPVPGLTSEENPVDSRQVYVLPLQGEWIANPPEVLPVEEIEACDPWPQYAMFVSEVELERLNLVRTDDRVIADKLADVERKLTFAEDIALQSTGRITFDGTTIDASPENAAIYQSLMKTGTIPGLPDTMAGPPAWIGPVGDAESNSRFNAWELAAAAIGAAASKGTPLNVDTVEYYNRISGLTASTSLWGGLGDLVQSADSLATSEKFVDYSGFSYNRSETYKGSVTWLDVPTLTWKVSWIADVVPFTNLTPDPIGDRTLTGVVAFAQLADDVRAMSNFIPDNTFIPGFYMDVPGADTTPDQVAALTNLSVTLGTLPDTVFPAVPFTVTASLQSGGTSIDDPLLSLTIDDTVVSWDPGPVKPGYNLTTTFDVTLDADTSGGDHTVTLELVDGDSEPLATDTGTITVKDTATVVWGDAIPMYATQGTWAMLPLRVFAPQAGTGTLSLAITGPEALADGDVKVYGVTTAGMVAMPLTEAEGSLSGPWADVPLVAGITDVTWYASVAAGAPVGDYAFGVSLEGGNTLEPAVIAIFAPEVHGEQPPDVGDDTTAPVVTITPDISGSTATFALAADEDVMFECQLVPGGDQPGETWEGCSTSPSPAASSSITYADLEPGDYLFAARGTDKVGLVSTVVTFSWTVVQADTTPPTVTIAPVGDPGTTAAFTLEADEPATFECRLTKDGTAGTWEDCTSPVEYTALEDGTYVFSARAIDDAGNTSAEESSDSWTVYTPPGDTTPPDVTITPDGTPGAAATFTFSANETPVTFECQLTKNSRVLDAWATCESPKDYTNLKVGTYVFSARATDAAGNTSTADTVTWTVKKG